MSSSSPQPIAPSATVVLLRKALEGFEVLLMQRANELAFHGGAWVFPGGRVDPCDSVDADPLRCAMRAAARETREEAGLTIEPSSLVPFSHWTTPEGRTRRFATWFFAAEVDAQDRVVIDGSEMRDHRWLRAEEALLAHADKQLELPPPTFVTLTVLSRFTRTEDVLEHMRSVAPTHFVPRPRKVPLGTLSLYAGDVAYEAGDPEQSGPRHRLCMLESGWRYERSL